MDIVYAPLLGRLDSNDAGRRLAKLSIQTKVEKFVLSELLFAAESEYPDLSFRLEEPPRRDLTIRQNGSKQERRLVEWLEAKMCYSDCIARGITGARRADEYCRLLAQDAAKQDASILAALDQAAALTVGLFVFHRKVADRQHAYYPNFRNRKTLGADAIMDEAKRYCEHDIPRSIRRSVAETVEVRLDDATLLMGYFYRRPGKLAVGFDKVPV